MPGVIEFPPYRLDLRSGRLWRRSRPVALRPKAWALLRHLADPRPLVSKEELHAAIWGTPSSVGRHADANGGRSPAGVARRRPDAAHPRDRAPAGVPVHRPVPRVGGRGPGRGVPCRAPACSDPEAATFVGRDAELARLMALFRQASAGDRQVAFIEGELGIGKSTLVEAFIRAVRATSAPVLIGYGHASTNTASESPTWRCWRPWSG